jgi:hypothetical protein
MFRIADEQALNERVQKILSARFADADKTASEAIPPAPVVEDEEAALAAEHPSHFVATWRDDVHTSSKIDQPPVLIEA